MAPQSSVSQQGAPVNPTSGSDAGRPPLFCDIFVIEESATDEAQVLDALGASPDTDKLSDVVLDCLEKAIVSGQPSELQPAVDQLARHVLVSLVDSIPEAVKLYLVDIAHDEITDYVQKCIEDACETASAGLVPSETAQKLVEHLPPMVLYTALQSEVISKFPSAKAFATHCRRKNLSSLLELKSSEDSPFSPGWGARLLQLRQGSPPSVNEQAASGTPRFSAPSMGGLEPLISSSHNGISRSRGSHSITPSRAVFSGLTSQMGPSGSARESHVTLRPNPEVTSQDKRRVASRDADKAATAFKGGPFTGVSDARGLTGFWRQVNRLVLRRGWPTRGAEHYFLLTNLVDESALEQALADGDPVTVDDFALAVDAIHATLKEECGGHFEAEKLLTEPTGRGPQEPMTDYIGRLDDWLRRCSLAGTPLSDALIIRAFRRGVNDENCQEASYEYPGTWSRFRVKALTRAARADADRASRPRNPPKTTAPIAAGDRGAPYARPAASATPTSSSKGELCRNSLRGKCTKGERCPYRHLGPTECRRWAAEGRCRFGSECKFRHDRADGAAASAAGGRGRPQAPSSQSLQAIAPDESPEESALHRPSESDDEQLQLLWAVQQSSESSQYRRSGPTLTLYPNGQAPLRALLDSGAVRNYVGRDLATLRGWTITPCSTSAKLANGSVVKLDGTVNVKVTRHGKEHLLNFYVLPGERSPNGVDGSTCILGVQSMCALKISMYFDEVDGSRQVTIRSPAQPQGELAPARLEEEGRLHFVILEDEDLSVTVVEDSEALVLRCEEQPDETPLDAPSTDNTRSTLPNSSARLTENWRQVKAAPDYSIRLRPLAEPETKDCPQQTHAVEVRWTSSPLLRQGPVHDYSKNLFAALDPSQQKSYCEELERFQARGWWEPLPEDGVDGRDGVVLPEAIAFPVVQGVKVRPCIDLRRGNAISPPSSYPGDSCAVILAQVRVAIAAIARVARLRHEGNSKPERLSFCTLDAATAFYRIRLHDRTAVIRSLGRRFAARRLVFGLRCGPAVLREALTCLIDEAMLSVSSDVNNLPLLHWEYVDDICLLGEHQAVQRLKSEIIRLGGLWGFEFTPAKCHSLTFSPEGHVERFDSFRHLGVDFVYREDHPAGQGTLVLRCVTASDPRSETFTEGQRVNKRSLFRAAGAAFDPLSIHGDRGLAADYIRRVSGKWKAGWDQDVPLGKDEAKTLTIAVGILSARSTDCYHEVSFLADTLEIACDASPFGTGFVATLSGEGSPRVTLSSRARALRGPMLNWHQNRKEAYGLAAAHVFADALVPYLYGMHLRFLSDSRTALSWLRGGSKLTCKSVERLAISRLCEAIADVRETWQRKYRVTPELLHIPAEQNSDSDGLSRLAFSWGIPDSIIFEGRGVVHDKAVQLSDEDIGSGCAAKDPTVCDVENQLRVIAAIQPASQGVLGFGMEHGRPSRQRLLALQWASPTANFILRSLGSSPPPEVAPVGPAAAPLAGVAAELPDFLLADDGILMKRSQTPKVNGISATRTCYYVPTDTADGDRYAHSIVDAYHRETGCLNRRYIRWLVSRCFYIPRLRSFIEAVCGTCEGCRLSSNRRFYSTTDSARSLRTGVQECWSTVSADLAEMGWDRKRRLCAVLVMTCHFSGFTVVSPLKDQKSATVATEMARLFDLLGSPALLRTDGGPCFRGRPLAEFLSQRAVEHRVVSPYAPFSNGLAERAVASVKFLARQLGDKKTWPTTLGKVIRRLNCKPFLDTDLSPFEIFYGRSSRLSPENSLAEGGVDGGVDVARVEVRDEITKLVKAAIGAREQVMSDARGLRRKGPPPIGSTVVLFNPDTLGRGGRYAPDVFRVHDIVRGVILRLVNASIPPDEVTSQLIKETHYANVRPCNLPSGGHVE